MTVASASSSGRPGLRNEPDDSAARVLRVDPTDGAAGVFRDAPIVLRLSHPADLASLSGETVMVQDPEGTLAGSLGHSPDAQVLYWRGARPFVPGVLHFIVACGLRDDRGRSVTKHVSRFVPCDLAREDLFL
jgi:hypothetical protein